MIPNFRLKSAALAVFMALAAGVVAQSVATAQPGEDKVVKRLDRQIGNLIRSLKDIKWQDITIYKLGQEYYKRLEDQMKLGDQKDKDRLDDVGKSLFDEPLAEFGTNSITCATPDAARKDFKRWLTCIIGKYGQIPPDEWQDPEKEPQLKDAWNLAGAVVARRKSFPKAFYLITSRNREGTTPRLIALAGMEQDDGTGNSAIKQLWAGTELYTRLRSNGPDSTMYSDMKETIVTHGGELTNQMFSMRDMSEITLVERTRTRVQQIPDDRSQYVLTSISDGWTLRRGDTTTVEDDPSGAPPPPPTLTGNFPMAETPNTLLYPYEIGVGTDVIASFREYAIRDRKVADLMWGVELRSGLDELNYPSIWGGRMTLSAMLENVRVGVVLPTLRLGDTSIASSGFSSQPQRIIGGVGVAFNGDFAAPVLSNSGLFNFHASYTASASKSANMIPLIYERINGRIDSTKPIQAGETAYLIRFAFQGYYSFGFAVDAAGQHLFRVKVGGTVYGVDDYNSVRVKEGTKLTEATLEKAIDPNNNRQPKKTESFGGVSVKLEYMKTGQRIPYGVSVQYFDQSLMGDLWVQFIVNQGLDIKVGGKLAMPVLRELHPWENTSIFAPTIAMRYHFN